MRVSLVLSLILIGGMFIVASCSKKSQLDKAIGNNDKLTEVLKLKGDEQRIAFNLLSSEEKRQVWQLHIEHFASGKILSSVQTELLDKLKEANKAVYYEQETDEKEIALQIFREQWIEKAKTAFQVDDIYTVAFTLNDVKSDADFFYGKPGVGAIGRNLADPDRSPYNDESLPNCNCTVGSSFTCPKFTIKWDSGDDTPSVSATYNPCTYNHSTKCDVEGGCGFMGWSACDGNRCS